MAFDSVARPRIVSFTPVGGVPYVLETRALVPAEGSRSNVVVQVDSFGPITASLTKFGKSTSPLALPVGLQNFPPDADFDGAPDETENAGGNGGDGDQDGNPDSQQSSVTTLPAGVNNDWFTIRMASPGLLSAVVPKNDLPPPPRPTGPRRHFSSRSALITLSLIAPISALL